MNVITILDKLPTKKKDHTSDVLVNNQKIRDFINFPSNLDINYGKIN